MKTTWETETTKYYETRFLTLGDAAAKLLSEGLEIRLTKGCLMCGSFLVTEGIRDGATYLFRLEDIENFMEKFA